MNLDSSYKLERKNSDTGGKMEWRVENENLRPASYLRLEMAACQAIEKKLIQTLWKGIQRAKMGILEHISLVNGNFQHCPV